MQLNIDCVRDILLSVEAKDFGKIFTVDCLLEILPQYQEDEITYACLKLGEAGMLDISAAKYLGSEVPGIKSIRELTYSGHQFLENIKSDNNWSKTKEIAKSVGSSSIDTVKQIAVGVISSVIQSHLQI